jgi:hypothetical protein
LSLGDAGGGGVGHRRSDGGEHGCGAEEGLVRVACAIAGVAAGELAGGEPFEDARLADPAEAEVGDELGPAGGGEVGAR